MPKNPTKKQVKWLYAVASGKAKENNITPAIARKWLKEAGYEPPKKRRK